MGISEIKEQANQSDDVGRPTGQSDLISSNRQCQGGNVAEML